jgi:GTP-binding protein
MVQKKGSRKSRKNIVEPREVVSRDSVGPATGVVGFPVVVILGRPNVGKSTLFNALVGSRRAIVGDEPGITRDRLYHEAGWRGRPFILVDTGGLLPDDKESMPREIMRQAEMALAEADAVLFIVDTQEGLNPLDVDISKIILRSGKPSFLVANKADSPNSQLAANAFYQLGMARVYPVSAEHHLGLDSLLDDLTSPFPEEPPPVGTAGEIRVAIIGRPNVGKSSVVNSMLGTERMIVSEIPGTTRDAVDTELELNGCRYRLIDTAGIRRKGKTKLKAEKISVIQARKHMENADLALLLLDPVEGVTHLDSVIAGYALEY